MLRRRGAQIGIMAPFASKAHLVDDRHKKATKKANEADGWMEWDGWWWWLRQCMHFYRLNGLLLQQPMPVENCYCRCCWNWQCPAYNSKVQIRTKNTWPFRAKSLNSQFKGNPIVVRLFWDSMNFTEHTKPVAIKSPLFVRESQRLVLQTTRLEMSRCLLTSQSRKWEKRRHFRFREPWKSEGSRIDYKWLSKPLNEFFKYSPHAKIAILAPSWLRSVWAFHRWGGQLDLRHAARI